MLDHRALLHAAPDRYLILAPDEPVFTIVDVSDAYLRATMTVREQIVGRGLFEVFPDNPDDPNADGTKNLRASLHAVLTTRAPHAMAVQKYDIKKANSDEFEERHWAPLNSPIVAGDRVTAIIHRVDDITRMVALERAAERRARELDEKNRALEAATQRLARIAAERLAPVLVVAPRVLLIPLVGELDGDHAAKMTETLLDAVRRERPHTVVLDLTAASGFDSGLAQRIVQTSRATQLLGARVVIAGLPSDAAVALVSLGVTFDGVECTASLSDAIVSARGR